MHDNKRAVAQGREMNELRLVLFHRLTAPLANNDNGSLVNLQEEELRTVT